ncbi:hypothetical protein NP233_g1468 [Leucocoprinus birnbaumii]|uniref:CFEM domain-containing protein n=1 Tax=Leucocoprinus birnbaumii TaxID=56174 RepID=A0AAD5YZM3_9AGAR|nr:hypothetical protein NP233_g1468 [Leucocoprinus birnbaumii]
MRFSLAVAVAALASTVSASLIARQDSLPQCALECLTTANFGNCSSTDDACLCRNQDFLNSSTTCIGQKCTGQDLENATAAARQLCLVVGVTLTSTPAGFPTLTGTLSNSAAATGTAPAASGSGSGSGAASAPAATPSNNAASANGVNTVASLAAFGLAALVL